MLDIIAENLVETASLCNYNLFLLEVQSDESGIDQNNSSES